jgi:nicotinamidase/pyrazinamidase
MCTNKILVVVDYQNDFVNGSLPCGKDAENIEDYIFGAVEKYVEKGRVYFTLDRHTDYALKCSPEGKLFPAHCMKNTPGIELYGKLNRFIYSPDVKILFKNRYASFKLIEELRDNMEFLEGKTEITFMGVATNICLMQNALACYNFVPDAETIVDANGCASWDKTKHKEALTYMKEIGITVINDE